MGVMQRSENMRVVFRSFDEDKSGKVSYAEFRRALAGLNVQLTAVEFDALCRHLDADGSRQIEYAEFVNELGANKAQDKDSFTRSLTHDRPGSASSSVFSSSSRPSSAASNRSSRPSSAASSRSSASNGGRPSSRHSSRSSVRGKQAKQLAALSSKSMANLMDKYAV